MIDNESRWAIGVFITLGIAMAGAFRNLSTKMSNNTKDIHGKIDKVKEDYVRRDDFKNHLDRIEGNIHEIRDEAREGKKEVLAAILEIKK